MIMVFGVRPGMGIAGATGNREEGFLPPRRLRFRGVPTGSISSSAAATMVFITRHGTGMPGPSGIGQEGFLLQRQWRVSLAAPPADAFLPAGDENAHINARYVARARRVAVRPPGAGLP